MKDINIVLLFFLLIVFSGCSEKTNNNITSTRTVVPAKPCDKVDFSLALEENIDFIGKKVQDFFSLAESKSLLISTDQIFVYSDQGNQLYQIGKKGEGLGEYIRVDKAFVSDNYVYIWNSAQKKLLSYSFSGKHIKDYAPSFYNMANFVVYKDSLLCCLFDGTEDDKSLGIYDLNTMSTIASFRSRTEEDQLLFLADNAGGICLNGNKLYWSYPSKLALHTVNLENLEDSMNEWVYKDEDFVVSELKEKAYDIINSNKLKAMEFIHSNSRIIQVSAYNDFVFIMAETGKISWQANGAFDLNNRKLKVYKIDAKNGTSVDTFIYDIPKHCGLAKIVNDYLCIFRASFSEDDFQVWMDKTLL